MSGACNTLRDPGLSSNRWGIPKEDLMFSFPTGVSALRGIKNWVQNGRVSCHIVGKRIHELVRQGNVNELVLLKSMSE